MYICTTLYGVIVFVRFTLIKTHSSATDVGHIISIKRAFEIYCFWKVLFHNAFFGRQPEDALQGFMAKRLGPCSD